MYLYLLLFSVATGIILGFLFRKHLKMWAIADLIWTCLVIISLLMMAGNIEKRGHQADRVSAMDTLSHDKDMIRIWAYILNKANCGKENQSEPKFCKIIEDTLFYTSRSNFSDLDANRLARQLRIISQASPVTDSINLISCLNEYGRFYAMRKDWIQTNPYQELITDATQFSYYVALIMLPFAFRIGKSVAEVGRLYKT